MQSPSPARQALRRRHLIRSARLVILAAVPYLLLLCVLCAPAARPMVETPFAPRRLALTPLVVPLEPRAAQGGQLFRARLRTPHPEAFADHPELRLVLETTGRLRVEEASLRVVGTSCTFVGMGTSGPGGVWSLALFRTAECGESVERRPSAIDLEVRARGEGGLALHAFEAPGEDAPGLLWLSAAGSPSGLAIVRGALVGHPPWVPVARVALLNYQWQISPRLAWLWAVLLASFLLAVFGLHLFPTGPVEEQAVRASGRRVAAGGAGAFGLAAALGLAHAVVSPPLAAPDEPYHLLAFASLAGRPDLDREVRAWMRLTHVQRLRFGANRFRIVNIGRPYVRQEDPFLGAPDVRARSAAAALVWGALARPLAGWPAPPVLLAIRFTNALAFAAAVGACGAFAVAWGAGAFPQLLVLPFLLVPAVPFLAMHVSEIAVRAGACALVATGLGLLLLDGPRATAVGFPLGLGTAWMLASGRAAWPCLMLVLAALALRALLGPRGAEGDRGSARRAARRFWLGFALGASAFYLLPNPDYLGSLAASGAPGTLGTLLHSAVATPLGLWALCLAGFAIERTLDARREEMAGRLAAPARRLVAVAGTVLAGAVVASLILSLALPFPVLPLLAIPKEVSVLALVGQTIAAALTVFRLSTPDYLFFTTFWAAFGWQDTLPPPVVLSALSGLQGLGATGLLLHLARGRDVRRFFWLAGLALGGLAALAAAAIGVHALPLNLNGRYLMGWHLALLAAIAAWPVLVAPLSGGVTARFGPFARLSRSEALLALAAALQTYGLTLVLTRYF